MTKAEEKFEASAKHIYGTWRAQTYYLDEGQ